MAQVNQEEWKQQDTNGVPEGTEDSYDQYDPYLQIQSEQERRSTTKKSLRDVVIDKISVAKPIQRQGKKLFILNVTGRTKYLHSVHKCETLDFKVAKRYSELLEVHRFLEADMKSYLQKAALKLPEFPPKKWIKTGDFANKRALKLN